MPTLNKSPYEITPTIPVAIDGDDYTYTPPASPPQRLDDELDAALLQAVDGMTAALMALRSILRKRKERRLLP